MSSLPKGRSAYSPRAYATRACLMERVACDPGGAEQLLEPGVRSALRRELPGQTALGPFKTEIANYATLAFSSRRAHKAETEAQAYFSIGVLHDNVGQFHAALESYRQFRETAVAMRDPVAEALASNCTHTLSRARRPRTPRARALKARTLETSSSLSLFEGAVGEHTRVVPRRRGAARGPRSVSLSPSLSREWGLSEPRCDLEWRAGMGVDCMLSACPPSAAAGFGAAQLSEQAQASRQRPVMIWDARFLLDLVSKRLRFLEFFFFQIRYDR